MAIENIIMPQLGESVTEGTITNWLVQPGVRVNKYDPIAEVMTDKVNAEIPSSFTGTIAELLAKDGDTLAVGETICTIETTDTANANVNKEPIKGNSKNANMEKAIVNQQEQSEENRSGKTRYSPAVLKMSQEHGIDLSQVEGSGKEGRITRKDLKKLIDSGSIPTEDAINQQNEVSPPISPVPKVPETLLTLPGDVEIPITGVRRAIADKMLRSKQEVPHAWTMTEVDVTSLVKYRDSLKTEFKKQEGYNLTYFAFFIKAVAQALKDIPMINSMWAGDKIIQKKDINISIAVATDDALFVPVIKNADEKSIKGIAKEIAELAQKTRNGSLTNEDIQGGTFTVNNTGSFGSIQSMGIINHPQAAILQIESIVKRPVIINDMIAVRDMVNICLSLDHRVLDGVICGKFLQRIKNILENISKETTSIY
ncbi:dihydrolipoamide acetyltransferase family protein [Lederbergia lenta]|uniref:Dihydrolipoamide acetyltransferase component of pyruvate dehydrogenase complex n=1 Tax=Lederbergia lenta TaxID=1467 RepID=A0A2X4VWI0_LEDLE|nr:dihydrolipoamide acetyltransferase family protein [Lederbergia lenta]MEC2325119.1 dihydrolipoamide acetyltransferase family protein [Lederbergia lenta]SQI56386.1 branched-chain alpha-keto acid dehydrogenase subunit E2 [Lederbergia lenta]